MSGYVLPRLAAHDIPHGSLMNAVVLTHSGLRFTSIDTCTNSANVVRNQATFPCAKLFRHISKIIRMGAEKQVIGPNAQPHVTGVAHEQGRVANRPVMQFIRKAMRRYDGYLRAKVDATVARFFVRFAGPQPAGVSLTHSRPEPLFSGNPSSHTSTRITAKLCRSVFLFVLRQNKRVSASRTGKRFGGTSRPCRALNRTEIALAFLKRYKKREESSPTMGTLTRKFATLSRHLISNQMGVTAPDVPASRGFFTFNSITLPGVYLMKEV